MIVETPSLGPINTSWVYLSCPLTIFCNIFGMDLVCLPLRNLDVILGINWSEFNHVHIYYLGKTVSYPEFDASYELLVSVKQVDKLVKDIDIVFMILAFVKAKIIVVFW